MKEKRKDKKENRRGRVQVKFNTGQRVHKSKKDYKDGGNPTIVFY